MQLDELIKRKYGEPEKTTFLGSLSGMRGAELTALHQRAREQAFNRQREPEAPFWYTQENTPDLDPATAWYANRITSGNRFGGGVGRGGNVQAVHASETGTFEAAKDPGVLKLVGGAALKGLDQAMGSLTGAADLFVGRNITNVGKLLGQDWSGNPISALNERMNEAQETNRAYFQDNVDRFGKIGQAVDKYGTMAAAAVPQALMAMATAGGSGAAEGLKTAANVAPGVLASVKTGTQAMLRDPQYWLSFFSTVNDSAEQARADGADDVHAALYAMTNSLFNAGVEVGGGIQTLPKELRAGRTAALEWVRSMVDEGKEEAVQGVLERGLQNLIYQKENPAFSATDPDAVFNPRTAAEEFTGGAVVGGLLGGGQVLAGRAMNAAAARGTQRETAVPLSDTAVNQNGLLAFSTQEKINLSSGAKNKVITTFNDTVAFIKTALTNKQSVDRAFLGKVPESVAEKVLNETGVDIHGYNAVLPSDAVRHMFQNHGNPQAEALRGQIAVTPEMAAVIPAILSTPNRVYLSDEANARRLPVLMFEKQIDNYCITAQAVADGSHSLQTDTLYIRKKNSQDTVSNTGENASPKHNARSVPPQSSSIDRISQIGENGNSKKGTSTSMVNAAENAASTYTPKAVEPGVPVGNITQEMKFVNLRDDGLGAADADFTTRGMEGVRLPGEAANGGYGDKAAQYMEALNAANAAAQLAALEEAYRQNAGTGGQARANWAAQFHAAAGRDLNVKPREAGTAPAAQSGNLDSIAGREKTASREGAGVQPELPVQVGRATTIKNPYQGVTPVQTQKPTAAVTVDESSVRTAENRIAGALELENSVLRTSFKATLKNAYKAVFKAAKGVPVEGMTYEGKPYTVDINNKVPGKVINDPNLTAEKLALLDVLPEVVRGGEYVGSGMYVQHGSKTKPVIRYDYFETPISIGSEDYVAKFDVEVYPDNNNYRTHQIIKIDLTSAEGSLVGPAPTASSETSSPVEGTRPLNRNNTLPHGEENVNFSGGGPGAADAGFTTRGIEGVRRPGEAANGGYGDEAAKYMEALNAANAAARFAALEEAYRQNTGTGGQARANWAAQFHAAAGRDLNVKPQEAGAAPAVQSGNLDSIAGREKTASREEAGNKGETVRVVEILRSSIPQLTETAPISTVSSMAIPFVEGGTMAEKARRLFEAIKGTVTRPGFGDVDINARSVKDDLSHGIGAAKAAVIPAIPNVIRNGVQIDFQKNWKDRPYDEYVFAAPVTMDGKIVYVAAVVKRTSKNRFYLHEVIDSDGNVIKIDNGESANPTSLAANGGAGAQSPLPIEGTRPLNHNPTIPHGAENVNSSGGGLGAADAGFTTRGMEGVRRPGEAVNGGQAARFNGANSRRQQEFDYNKELNKQKYAASMASTMLANGEMPDASVLSAAGISPADAINRMMAAIQRQRPTDRSAAAGGSGMGER